MRSSNLRITCDICRKESKVVKSFRNPPKGWLRINMTMYSYTGSKYKDSKFDVCGYCRGDSESHGIITRIFNKWGWKSGNWFQKKP